MTGTEKQVAWATEIKAKMIAGIDEIVAVHGSNPRLAAWLPAIEKIRALDNAAVWIAFRDSKPDTMIKHVVNGGAL